MSKYVREMTRKERQILAGLIGLKRLPERIGTAFVCLLVIISLVAFSVDGLSNHVAAVREHQSVFILLGFVVALLIAFAVDRKFRFQNKDKSLLVEIKDRKVIVERVEVVEAIRVQEFEDEGYGFYLKLKDGRVLFLTGQYLYEPTDRGEFPSSQVEIATTPQRGIVLSLRCLGIPLSPSAELPPFPAKDLRAGRTPRDGDFLEINFENLKRGQQKG